MPYVRLPSSMKVITFWAFELLCRPAKIDALSLWVCRGIKCEVECRFCFNWDLFEKMQSLVQFQFPVPSKPSEKPHTFVANTISRRENNRKYSAYRFYLKPGHDSSRSSCRSAKESKLWLQQVLRKVFHWNGHTLLRVSYTSSKATTPAFRIRNDSYCYGIV